MTLRMGTIVVAGCLLVGLGEAGATSEEEKEAAFEKAKGLMEAGDWKKAIKALKSYKKKYAKSEEEQKEVDALVLRAEGERKFAEIFKKHRKTSKIRPAVKGIRKFMQKYKEDLELLERAEEFYAALRSQYCIMITDFEEEDWPDIDDGMSAERDEGMVKHGLQSARWKTGIGARWVHIIPKVTDWTPYTYFCFWVYNAKKSNRPGYILIRPGSAGNTWEHHFEYIFPIDFKGWREIRIDFKGKKGFGKTGKADWAAIQEVQLYHPGTTGIAIEVVLDDMHLEKAVR